MSEGAYAFGVVCEARADQLTACDLADRVLLDQVDWLTPEVLDKVRRWRGYEDREEPFLRWEHVNAQFAQSGLSPSGRVRSIFGRFDGDAAAPDALTARKALLLLASLNPRPDAVLLVRDSDGDPGRRHAQGLQQARERFDYPFEILIAMAHPKREAWVLAGFQPENPEEQDRLQTLRERLSLDPILKSHELDAREHGAKKDIKRALRELLQRDGDRERKCLEETALSTLEERGASNGLAAFLTEVRERLVPILKGSSRGG